MLRSSVMGDTMRRGQIHIAVDLEVDRDSELAAEIVHSDVVDGEAGIAGDHHDAFADALVVARHRYRGKCQVGVAERPGDGILRLSLDLLDAVDRIGARHFTMASMKWVGPTMRTLRRSTSTTPGTELIAAVAFSAAPSGARSSRVSTVERANRRPRSEITTATAIAAAASPQA